MHVCVDKWINRCVHACVRHRKWVCSVLEKYFVTLIWIYYKTSLDLEIKSALLILIINILIL